MTITPRKIRARAAAVARHNLVILLREALKEALNQLECNCGLGSDDSGETICERTCTHSVVRHAINASRGN